MFLLTTALLLTCLPQTILQVQQREIHQQGPHYGVDIKYPEIENGDQFNAAVRQTVGSLTENFRKEMPDVSAPDILVGGYLNGSYNATILKNGIVSVLLDYSEYTPGAVHPWGVMASINYDSSTCRVLALSDLFRAGVNYVSSVSRLAIASLDQNEFADRHAIRHGAGPFESNFKVFTSPTPPWCCTSPCIRWRPVPPGNKRSSSRWTGLLRCFGNDDSLEFQVCMPASGRSRARAAVPPIAARAKRLNL